MTAPDGPSLTALHSDRTQSTRLGLLARIHRQYQTMTETLQIGGLELQFTRIADPNRVLDQVAEEEDRREKLAGERALEPLHLPYWAEVWESAMGIGAVLEKQGFSRSVSVLDLGCGMGLAGTVAAGLGASVLFADIEAPALLFAKLNSLEYADRVRTRRLDWRKDRLTDKFDLILGADILYDKTQWYYLDPFWRGHLAQGGRVLLGEPGRQTGDLFVPWIESRRWNLTRYAHRLVERNKTIRLLELTL